MRRLVAPVAAVAATVFIAGLSPVFAQDAGDDGVTLDDIAAAFGKLAQSEIEALGYVVETSCVDASGLSPEALEFLDIPPTAAMGFHAANEALFDDTVAPLEPEAILLGPDGEVWGVEYAASADAEAPSVLGRELRFLEDGRPGRDVPHYALHAWFIDNPSGQFADFNSSVSCDPAPAAVVVSLSEVTAAFGELTRFELEAAGYVSDDVCLSASSFDAEALAGFGIPPTAAMGIHASNPALFDAMVDALEPETILLGPDGEVWGVEYEATVDAEEPNVFEQPLTLVSGHSPGRQFEHFSLHAWFVENPLGQFADFNPNVSCGTVSEIAPAVVESAPVQLPQTGRGGTVGDPAGVSAAASASALAGTLLLVSGWFARARKPGGGD